MRELRQQEKGRSEEIGTSWMQDERTQSSLGTPQSGACRREEREREREREREEGEREGEREGQGKDGERDRGREALIS